LSNAGSMGTITHQLANLSNLHSLNIQCFSLQVDNLQWLSHLSLLEFLDLSMVNLSKASNWIQVMNTLPSLSKLCLSSCELDNRSFAFYVNFSSLIVLVLDPSNNSISDSVFDKIQSLSQLTYLDLSRNELEGKIPRFLGNFCNLQALDLSFNNLWGGVHEILVNPSTCISKKLEF
jgi:Leucine-rich repeat (LRR) protein